MENDWMSYYVAARSHPNVKFHPIPMKKSVGSLLDLFDKSKYNMGNFTNIEDNWVGTQFQTFKISRDPNRSSNSECKLYCKLDFPSFFMFSFKTLILGLVN